MRLCCAAGATVLRLDHAVYKLGRYSSCGLQLCSFPYAPTSKQRVLDRFEGVFKTMRVHALSIGAILSACLISLSSALFQDEAYHIDFHYALLGTPIAENTFFYQPSSTLKGSLLYTLSEKLVLGAINPKDGSLVWRQDIAEGVSNRSATQGFLRAANNTNLVVTAVGGKVKAWDATNGRMVWEREEKGTVRSLTLLEVDPMTVSEDNGVVHISRLNGANGRMIWEVQNR